MVLEQVGFFDQHLWLLCAVVWSIGPRLPHHWSLYSRANEDKRRELVKVLGLFPAVACIALWFIQLTSGLASGPFLWTWQSPQRWLALIVLMCFWVSILWWGFLREGIQMIADAFSLKLTVASMILIGFAIFSITITALQYLCPGE